ncbi:MAG: antiviral reverse transcriptase Drt4 [Hydrogenophaga sp.]|uniref:antiviral reverse transcriptase Drt4 n=1 Tax=Hydrogenophaga sp. TaxID=1904254 RepID=UPI002735AF1C|nr:antiviral reverse transcriptase Drt4 [Hydrogenophaga sp.]MDP3626414.1 antiviral reverse transcriptase Drt4 [Hydrogenophaga sp.]
MKEFAVSHTTNAAIIFDERHFLEALSRWNYFPNQKASASELPPNICTRRFTPEVVQKLHEEVKPSRERRRLGFDLAEYRATRYNNVSRILGLIHPLAFAHIFVVFESNRAAIRVAMDDPNSAISVEAHTDGRMLIMNYEDHQTKALTDTEKSFGKKFRAHTDVANCFGSVYTHSLEWAIQGFEAAKASKASKSASAPTHWSSDLDRVLRWAKRNETSGLPIGPAFSSIAVEIILAAVDRELRKQFSFVRYVDDYTALCDSHDEAQEFIRLLGTELSRYRLTLNLAKTSIVELPEPLQEKWVSELMSAAPALIRDAGQPAWIDTADAFQFLDLALRLNNETPDGSVIKFAVAVISARLKDKAAADVFQYVLNLAWHYPILLPYLEKIDGRAGYYDAPALVEKLNKIISINALHRRSDGICWALYYLERLGANPSEKSVSEIILSKDCVAIAMLCNFEDVVGQTIEFSKELTDASLYVKDQHWLLLYQLYRMGRIENPYPDEATFELLKKYDVDFFCPANEMSHAENFCFQISNPFAELEKIETFDRWIQSSVPDHAHVNV